jgi:hypothetical protein
VRKADRPGAHRSADLDALDLDVVAFMGAPEHIVERVTRFAERIGPIGNDDGRLKLHATSIARGQLAGRKEGPGGRSAAGSDFRRVVGEQARATRGADRRYVGVVAPRTRVLAFGSAAALVVAGAICAAVVGGLTGEVLAIALITLGLGAVVLLLFLEVGLSEERELAKDEKPQRQKPADREPRLRRRRRPG